MDSLLLDNPAPFVRRLTLNRPDKRNAPSNELRGRLFEALEAADRDPDVRISILRGAGTCFSAGYDLGGGAAQPLPHHTAGVLAMAERVAKISTDVQQMNKRSVHRSMEIMGLRASIRAGAEIQALAMTTPSSRETFARFRQGVSQALDARDGAFGDDRTTAE